MNSPSDLDQQPWYRQFWFWFLVLLPASVVVAGLTTVYIAIEGADDLVADEYYKDGLSINRQLEKVKRARALGLSASLEFSDHSVAVSLAGQGQTDTLYLVLSHPMEANRDFTIVLQQIEPGFYAGILDQPIFSRWHWTLENRGQPGWRLDGSITLNSSTHDITR